MIPFPDKKYNIIYADPPWKYQDKLPKMHGGAERHYPCMATESIKELPVETITMENSCLFLWSTFPFMPDALEVITAWGFKYKTNAFTWIKRNKSDSGFWFGLGRWTRGNAEVCLFATKGKPTRVNNSISQLIFAPVTKHSRKPPEVRAEIVNLLGDIPRIELFARQKVEGWDSIGFDIDGCDIRESLDKLVTL